MKKQFRKKKRDTLSVLLAKYIGSALLLAVIFAVLFQNGICTYIHYQSNQQIEEMSADTQQNISKLAAQYEGEALMREISCRMAAYQFYDIFFEDPLNRPDKMVQLVPKYSPKCHSASALVNESGEVVASNKLAFMVILQFSNEENDPANGWYVCDREALNLPEVDQLYADYRTFCVRQDTEHFANFDFGTAYVNKETHSFIPHEGTITLDYEKNTGEPLIEENDTKRLEAKEVNITVDLEGYELMKLNQGVKGDYPRAILCFPQGEDPEDLAQYQSEFIFRDEKSYTSGGYQENNDGTETYSRNVPVWIEKQPYWLTLCFTVNPNDPTLKAYYWRWTVVFAVFVLIVSLLLCWRKYVVNKAKYRFEDYQRDLTNHLAHDIKTPLTAIGGYAENLMEGQLSADEQQRYLQGILDNVAFTDSLVSHTLCLNSMDGVKKPERVKIAAEGLVHDAFAKYALMLEEKHIRYSVSGSAELRADKKSLGTIIENLVANAVKYTPENGEIKAVLDKKRITITNTVPEKISTKDLMRPFFRGDKARSNADGAGLGLSIADRAASENGCKLSLSCSDTEFRAELKQ